MLAFEKSPRIQQKKNDRIFTVEFQLTIIGMLGGMPYIGGGMNGGMFGCMFGGMFGGIFGGMFGGIFGIMPGICCGTTASEGKFVLPANWF